MIQKSNNINKVYTGKFYSNPCTPSFISFLCVFAESTQIIANENILIDPFLYSKVSILYTIMHLAFFHLKCILEISP